jgi:hypothetical protein
METVRFHNSASHPAPSGLNSLVANANAPVAQAEPTSEFDFVNTSQGASPGPMQTSVIPNNPGEFVQLMTKPLQPAALASPPMRRRRPRRVDSTPTIPRRSSRLAKKASNRVPAVAAAQNLLMRKLGLSTGVHVESEDFDRYLRAFKDGLTEEQVNLIRELFKEHTSDPVASLEAADAE